jgi:hypothetical protein
VSWEEKIKTQVKSIEEYRDKTERRKRGVGRERRQREEERWGGEKRERMGDE